MLIQFVFQLATVMSPMAPVTIGSMGAMQAPACAMIAVMQSRTYVLASKASSDKPHWDVDRAPNRAVGPGGRRPTGPAPPKGELGSYKGPGGNARPVASAGPAAPTPGSAPVAMTWLRHGRRHGRQHLPSSRSIGTLWWDVNKEPFLLAFDDMSRRMFARTNGDDETGADPRGRPSPQEGSRTRRTRATGAVRLQAEPQVAGSCLLALARIGATPETGASLVRLYEQALGSDEQLVAELATISLGVLGLPEGAPSLTALLHNEKSMRRLLGRTEVPYRMRAFAAYALGLIARNRTMQPYAGTSRTRCWRSSPKRTRRTSSNPRVPWRWARRLLSKSRPQRQGRRLQ